MPHYRRALDLPERCQACAVFHGRVLGSRAFFAEVEAGLAGLDHPPTLIMWTVGGSSGGRLRESRCPGAGFVLLDGLPGWLSVGGWS